MKQKRYRRSRVILLGLACVMVFAASDVPWVGVSRARAEGSSKALPDMVTPEAVRRTELGLKYLADRQRNEGSWSSAGSGYSASYPITMTALAGMAFLAGGSTPESGTYSKNVSRAVNYLLNVAESSVQKGDKKIFITVGSSRSMYGHGFAMLFLAQCYGMEGDRTSKRGQRIKRVLEGAVKLTVDSQSKVAGSTKPAGGWTYSPSSNYDEGSVTVTQLQALRACRNVGIKVPKTVIDKTVNLLRYNQMGDGGICYSSRSRGSGQPAVSAAAIACFYAAGIYDKKTGGRGEEAEMVEKLVKFCKSRININSTGMMGHWFYIHFYYSQAMYQRGGKDWKEYYPVLRDRLCKRQSPDGSWSGSSVGQIYGTALGCIMLQLPNGYLPICQK